MSFGSGSVVNSTGGARVVVVLEEEVVCFGAAAAVVGVVLAGGDSLEVVTVEDSVCGEVVRSGVFAEVVVLVVVEVVVVTGTYLCVLVRVSSASISDRDAWFAGIICVVVVVLVDRFWNI